MPGFCVTCGAPVLGAFCNQCGSKTIQPGTPVQSSAAAPVVPSTSVLTSGASWSPTPVTFQGVTPVVTPVVPPAPMVTNPPPVMTMAKPSSGVGKAFLWIGLILLVLFLGIAGSTVYGYYWAKHKITSIAS